MSKTPEILALGEPLIEFVKRPDELDGHPVFTQSLGGDTSNAIISAARQGAVTGYITAIGDDTMGKDFLDLWENENVDISYVKVCPQDPTGVYFVQPHPTGRYFSYARRGSAASLYRHTDLPVEAIAKAKILHVSAISQAISETMCEAVTQAAKIAQENNTLVSYDTNLRLNLWSLDKARESIYSFLPYVDIVFPSDDEAYLLTKYKDPDEIVEHFFSFGAQKVILKRGVQGTYLATPYTRKHIPTHKVEAIDSTGAGDSYAGAFLAYFLETEDAELAARRAAVVASGTVSGFGAVNPIPHRDFVLSVSGSSI